MKINLVIVLTFLLLSCQQTHLEIEFEVINDTFIEAIGTDYYLMPLPIPPYKPIHPDSMDFGILPDTITVSLDGHMDTLISEPKQLYNEYLEEYNNFDWNGYYAEEKEFQEALHSRKRDTANLVLISSDSLIAVSRELLNRDLSPKSFALNFSVDTTWRSLVLKLADSIESPRPLKFSELSKTGLYHLIRESDYEPNLKDRIVGYINISRVAIDENLGRACYYFSINCRGDCGWGSLMFAEKVNGKWKLIGTHGLWIS